MTDQKCQFCRSCSENYVLGEMIIWQDLVAHINCLYTASGLVQKSDPERLSVKKKMRLIDGFDPNEVRTELKRGQRLRCRHCGINGACVGCSDKKCRATFHLNCLFDAKGFALFKGSFLAYCVYHRPLQDLKSRLSEYIEPPDCCICLFSIIDEHDTAELEKIPEGSPYKPQNRLPFRSPPSNNILKDILSVSSPSGSGKCIHIIDGQVPLSPVAMCHKSSSNCKRISMWEVDVSLCLEDIGAVAHTPKPTLPLWQRRLLRNVVTPATPKSGDGVFMTTPTSVSKARGNASSMSFYTSWSHSVLHGQCCRPAWMHRECVAGYARSAGLHHVKCPLCFNRDTFIQTLLDFGIWIPDRDASWELEPGAFAYSEDPPPQDRSIEDEEEEDGEEEENDNSSSSSSCSSHADVVETSVEVKEKSKNITISPSITPLKELSLNQILTPRRSIRHGDSTLKASGTKTRKESNTVEIDEVLTATTPLVNHRLSLVTEMSPDIENQPPKQPTIHEVLKFSPPMEIKRRRTRRPSAGIIRNSRSVGVPRQRTVSMLPQRQKNINILKQTSIDKFFEPPSIISINLEEESDDDDVKSIHMEATNKLFRSFLATNLQPSIRRMRIPSGRYSLRSSVSSVINSPGKKTYSQLT